MPLVLTKVTWYSRLLAVLFFIFGFPILTFYIGMQYQETRQALEYYGVSVVVPESTIQTLGSSENDLENSPVAVLSGIQGIIPGGAGSIIVKQGAEIITETMIPESGKFVLLLDPGTYTLTSDADAFASASIAVKKGMMATVSLSQ